MKNVRSLINVIISHCFKKLRGGRNQSKSKLQQKPLISFSHFKANTNVHHTCANILYLIIKYTIIPKHTQNINTCTKFRFKDIQ